MRAATQPVLLILHLLVLLLIHDAQAKGKRRKCGKESWSEGKIVEALLSNYSKMLPEAEDSVIVNIEIHVQGMSSLNEITADFDIELLFTQLWHDPALSFAHLPACKRNITMESNKLSSIWTPNTCIINSKQTMIHHSPAENVMFILYESYSHNSEEVELHWMQEAVTLMNEIILPDFAMVQYKTHRETLLYPNGYWDQLRVQFIFKRLYGFYIIQAYVPTYLTIIVSWVSFCMEPKALPARTTVGISSLLALTFQFGNILKNLPRVSYVKAMDVWMLGCISFVFGTMVELAFVCYIGRVQNSSKGKVPGFLRESRHNKSAVYANGGCRNRTPFRPNGTNATAEALVPNGNVRETALDNGDRRNNADAYRLENGPPPPIHFHMAAFEVAAPINLAEIAPLETRAPSPQPSSCSARLQPESIDKMSIVCFPLAFTLFNLFYWWYYLQQTFEDDYLPIPHENAA